MADITIAMIIITSMVRTIFRADLWEKVTELFFDFLFIYFFFFGGGVLPPRCYGGLIGGLEAYLTVERS